VTKFLAFTLSGAAGFIGWLDALVATSIDVSRNRRTKWSELGNICNLLII
jgi:hypothetical protein